MSRILDRAARAALVVATLAGCGSTVKIEPARPQPPVLGPALISNERDEPARARPAAAGKHGPHAVNSADGHWVAFPSPRGARVDGLSEDERAAYAADPHALDDIYVERSAGGGLKRLTRDAARNDQPAFAPDAKRVVFTHHALDGLTAEIYSVSLQDLDVRRLTRLDVISEHAVYHPDGAYVAFVSRAAANDPASILVIDAEGRHDPILVTENLRGEVRVEFEAHGEAIVWTTDDGAGQRARRRARWNDRLARRRLGQKPIAPGGTAEPRAWVEYLADPYFAGRPTGGPREVETNSAIAGAFHELGLTDLDRGPEMPFGFVTEVTLGEKNDLELNLDGAVSHLALSGDWIPTSLSATGEFPPAPIVFAGYGLVTPAEGPEPAYDAYQTLDVTDKWVAIFAGLPTRVTGARRFYFHQRGRFFERALTAQARGAAGVLVLDDPAIPARAPRLRTFGRPEALRIPVLRLARRQGERLFQSQGTSVTAWGERLADGAPAQLTFPRASARASIDFGFNNAVARNVIAQIKVPGATTSVVIGAYADGMGRGERGGSLDANRDVIHPGANANASGVAAVIGLAERLTRAWRDQTFRPKQNVIFATWSGGEMGALGARAFAARRLVSVALNLRAVAGDRAALTARGVATSPDWPDTLRDVANATRATVYHVGPVPPDDAGAFAGFGVPAVTITAGPFADDRTARDVPEHANYASLNKSIEFTEELVRRLTSTPGPKVFTASSGRDRR